MTLIYQTLISWILIISQANANDSIQVYFHEKNLNTTINQFCTDYCSTQEDNSGIQDLQDNTAWATNFTFISSNLLLIATATGTIGGAIYKFRKPLSRWYNNLTASSLEMPIEEIIPSSMPETYKNYLRQMDQALCLPDKDGKKIWDKFPIYGEFHQEAKSWYHRLDCRKANKVISTPYLYGFLYDNNDYSIEISHLYIIKDIKTLNLKEFCKINTDFLRYGKAVERPPTFYTKRCRQPEDAEERDNNAGSIVIEVDSLVATIHPHINEINFEAEWDGAENFLTTFLLESPFLTTLLPSSITKESNVLLDIFRHFKSLPGATVTYVSKSIDPKSQTIKSHLYFLFPTVKNGEELKENFKLVLHLSKTLKDQGYRAMLNDNWPEFLSTKYNKHINFKLVEVRGDGDCGFYALDTTRKKSINYLTNTLSNYLKNQQTGKEEKKSKVKAKNEKKALKIMSLLAPEIFVALRENKFTLEESDIVQKNYETYVNLSGIVNDSKSEKDEIKAGLNLINEISLSPKLCLKYLENFKTPGEDKRGWLTHIPSNSGHTLKDTGLIDVIAYTNKVSLFIWQASDRFGNLKLVHYHGSNHHKEHAHILHNGKDHYDKLEVIK